MNNHKKKYISPKVEKIELDRNISIQMQSPPDDPFGDPKKPYIKEGSDSYDFTPFK